tara:strand:- start:245 stop:1069 length:825 start_codon:yes stop_codon:yes gene_type:complete
MKYISICSDDFGLSSGINSGIIDCVKYNRITDVSCITIIENSKKDFNNLAKYKDKINIGLHLVLTDLYYYKENKKKKLPTYNNFLTNVLLKRINKLEIKKLINQQIDNFYYFFNKMPDFIDGHKHIHQFPLIFEIINEILVLRDLKNNIWIRNTKNINFRKNIKNFFNIKKILINFTGNYFKKILISNNFKTNKNFLGIYNFESKQTFRSIFLEFIDETSDKNLLACHPGYIDYSIIDIDSLIEERYEELKYLLSDEFIEDLKKKKITLHKYLV